MNAAVDFSSSTAALTLAVGLLLSLVCYLLTGLSPGGLIVPGWLALSLVGGWRTLVVCAVATALTVGASRLLLSRTLLYGKRLFTVVVLIGTFAQMSIYLALHGQAPDFFHHDTIGFIVPGLIAYQLIRQPPIPTIIATAVTTVASTAVVLVAVAI